MKIFIIPHPENNFNHLYTCPRGEAIVLQGLLANPEVELVKSPKLADYIILTYVPHANGEKWNTADIAKYSFFGNNLIVIDWTDESDRLLVSINQCLHYFKRSILEPKQTNCTYSKYKLIKLAEEKRVWPITYGILDEFPRSVKPFGRREVDIGCYLRPSCPNRSQVLNYTRHVLLNDFVDWSCSIGEVSSGSRSVGENVFVDSAYFAKLADTKINIVCNPSQWIGDSRLWESLVSGCLTVVDEDLYNVPRMRYLFGENLITYNVNNLPRLKRDLKDLMSDLSFAGKLAQNAQRIALENFTSKKIMEYVIGVINEPILRSSAWLV